MNDLYLYPMSAPGVIRVVELESAADFKRATEDVRKGEVALAHGYCTVCSAVTYYVRDYNMDGCSHICSKCGIRFCFQHGDGRYIDMDDIANAELPKEIKNEIRRLNSIPTQKTLIKQALGEFLKEKENALAVLDKEVIDLKNLQVQIHEAEVNEWEVGLVLPTKKSDRKHD